MKKLLYFLILLLLVAPSAFAVTNASDATIKVYNGYLSANTDCSDPVLFLNGDDETLGYFQVDMASLPTI